MPLSDTPNVRKLLVSRAQAPEKQARQEVLVQLWNLWIKDNLGKWPFTEAILISDVCIFTYHPNAWFLLIDIFKTSIVKGLVIIAVSLDSTYM